MKNKRQSDFDPLETLKTIILNEKSYSSEEDIQNEINEMLSEEVKDKSKRLLDIFLNEAKNETQKILKYENGFNDRLNKRWKIPIENLTYFIHRNIAEGKQFNVELRPDATKNNDFRFEALIRIHGQSCLIALEALCLLKSGFSDGANARWRTLFENNIYSMFISDNDQETAKRYLDYSFVEEYKLASNNQLTTDEELSDLKDVIKKLKTEHGDSFISKNGWYAHLISKNNERNFSTIMERVDMKHMGYWYKQACIKVHAGSDSLYQNLGLLNQNNLILSGPSNLGLSIPGQNIAISLAQTTNNLLLSIPNKDRLYIGRSLIEYAQIIQNQFIICQEKLIDDEINIKRETT